MPPTWRLEWRFGRRDHRDILRLSCFVVIYIWHNSLMLSWLLHTVRKTLRTVQLWYKQPRKEHGRPVRLDKAAVSRLAAILHVAPYSLVTLQPLNCVKYMQKIPDRCCRL